MYLEIDTITKEGKKFSHFIPLEKEEIEKEFLIFIKHLKLFDEDITRVRFVTKPLGAW